MAFDERLAERVRRAFRKARVVFEEKRMMGGLCFVVKGKMCVGVEKDRLMARIDPESYGSALQRKGCVPMDLTGRPMRGFVFVNPAGLSSDAELNSWLKLALEFNPKAKASKSKTAAASSSPGQPPAHQAKKHRIYTTSFARVYPLYVAKVERKGRKKEEVDAVIRWLTGYSQRELRAQLKKQTDFETFFGQAPKLNPSRALIKGVVCGVRVEDVQEPTMREIRYLDKLVDELAKGRALEKVLRS